MKEILTYLPVLAIAMAMNILVGTYYQIGLKKVKFNKTIFWSGLLKAGVIGLIFIGLSYCFDCVDLSSIGMTPVMIIHSAILLYTGKVVIALCKVLGVDINALAK